MAFERVGQAFALAPSRHRAQLRSAFRPKANLIPCHFGLCRDRTGKYLTHRLYSP